jgi:hypothetical protein
MDKNAIKKYAVWARTELIARVSQKADRYEVSVEADPNADSARGVLFTDTQKKQRAALINKVKEEGFEQVMEEVAYTWFNRFSALRFMEVNNYLPSRVRVFTDAEGNFKPQILTEAIHMELPGLDMEKVYALKEANNNDELFKYLIITQCNALSDVLPGMFQKIADYTEFLFPDNLLREGSIIQRMVSDIPEDDWKDQIQIIGWLYQYYNTEPKDKVFADLKKNIKISKENIPAATQLFTPDWIVRYMVENSLGRLWIEGHPNPELKKSWTYYLDEAQQEPEVEERLKSIRKEYAALKPEDIRCIDPCCGSGHICAYLFDVLIQIYADYGIQTRDAVRSIIEKNLWGLDIDERAAQLAYFSVMMKAVQYDPRFLRRKDANGRPDIPQPHIYAIHESNHLDPNMVEYFMNGDAELKKDMNTLIEELHDAKEYGSLLKVSQVNFTAIYKRFDEIEDEISIYKESVKNELYPFVRVAQALVQKYDVVVTNPPYMGGKGQNANLSDFLKDNYPDEKSDTFSAFIERCGQMAKPTGYGGMFTPYVWMFIQSYEKLRTNLYTTKSITTLIQFEYSAFEEATVPVCTFVYRNTKVGEKGGYFRLVDFRGGMEVQRQKYLEAIANPKCGYFYTASAGNFSKIPGSPVAYWVSEAMVMAFEEGKTVASTYETKLGMSTNDNGRFLREWFEVERNNICLTHKNGDSSYFTEKWFPYSKGGSYRKWFGNVTNVINWADDGSEVKALASKLYGSFSRTCKNTQYFFKPAVTWNLITSGEPSFRFLKEGCVLGDAGPVCFCGDGEYYALGLFNSVVTKAILPIINPTLNCSTGVVNCIPVKKGTPTQSDCINGLVKRNIELSIADWDSFETSWDFKRHPLILTTKTISDAYEQWKAKANAMFDKLKANEEELNRIFIDIYGLQNELKPEEEDKDVTVHRIYDSKDDIPESMAKSQYALTKQDVIKSFISYAVGCMFGRYSLDVEGLAFAGGEWDESKYKTFLPDKDNIIPISDDEYFEDDIVGLFVKFVETVYGKDTLEENLKFIADALGGKGSPREVIRSYFLNNFYKDHCRTYKKRPIYWLFDSGKKNGFKCLIYMHHYQPDTIARIRTDYIHEQQARYRTAIAGLERQMTNATTSERVRLTKQLTKLKEQAEETRIYEEKIHHLADQMISIDLDDGVKHNYAIFKDVLAKIK